MDAVKSAANGDGNQYDIRNNETRGDALRKIQTAGSLSISAELFEKIYLSPKTQVQGNLRNVLGNPAPIMGGIMMNVGGILEFILGNTFPCVVFMSFGKGHDAVPLEIKQDNSDQGTFLIGLAITLTPAYNASTAFDPSNPMNPGFETSFAYVLLFMGLMCTIYMICGLRTNMVLEAVFTNLTLGFLLLAASYWQSANSDHVLGEKLQVVSTSASLVAFPDPESRGDTVTDG
ncbi:hypothetical protein N0V85_009112 [Neurospora sp. IMI 360204]|nr:hypothetical protein N0V85_009112 [Neurospora sp. IMI 360204]